MSERNNGIVISSRARLARNYAGFKFPERLSDEEGATILKKTEDGFLWEIEVCDAGGVGGVVDFEALPKAPYIICNSIEWKIEIL